MTNAYLVLSETNLLEIKANRPEGIVTKFFEIKDNSLWIVTYGIEGNNESSARKMSEAHQAIMEYTPLVLSCESSAYYNKILFPIINELERKLRHLLYLAVSISDNENAKERISRLEEKDFGEIFELLFIDQKFIKSMKIRINADAKSEFNGKDKYSKNEILSYVDSLTENTLWDEILSESHVPTLRSQFRNVQTYRNGVMHAHNISSEVFRRSRSLFHKINGELDEAIDRIKSVAKEKPSEQKIKISAAVLSALEKMDTSSVIESFIDKSLLSQIAEVQHARYNLLEDLKRNISNEALDDIKEYISNKPPLSILEKIQELNRSLISTELLREDIALSEALRSTPNISIAEINKNPQRQFFPEDVLSSDQVNTLNKKQNASSSGLKSANDKSHSNQNLEKNIDGENKTKDLKTNETIVNDIHKRDSDE